MAGRGVRVNAVAPTYIDTPLTRFGMENPTLKQTWLEMTPMHRVGQMDEIASVVLFRLGRVEPDDRLDRARRWRLLLVRRMSGRLAGKDAAITGGTGGIGPAIAARYVAEGARVCARVSTSS